LGFGCLAYAEQVPQALSSDNRIQVVVFNENNVVPIHGTALTTTQIIFAPDEIIKAIQNGDLAAWSSSVDPAEPNMMFLKPTVNDSETNMTVVTNHHIYYFELSSGSRNPKNLGVTYAIKFEYPVEVLSAEEQIIADQEKDQQMALSIVQDPDKFNWNYSFNGDKTLVPFHAFDDGKFTYLQLRPEQPVPAVFLVDNSVGKESLVNVRMDRPYLIIQQTGPQFTLRDGPGHVASIFNNQRIAELRKGAS
jgi:type IV secretion system protein VirB9